MPDPRPLCGGCATDREIPTLHTSPTQERPRECFRCGFPTYLLIGEPAPACSLASHDAVRADVARFEEETTNPQAWAGVLTAECRSCRSTLSLAICALCPEPCALGDSIPYGAPHEGREAHFACVARSELARRASKFVIVVGEGKAREFARGLAS